MTLLVVKIDWKTVTDVYAHHKAIDTKQYHIQCLQKCINTYNVLYTRVLQINLYTNKDSADWKKNIEKNFMTTSSKWHDQEIVIHWVHLNTRLECNNFFLLKIKPKTETIWQKENWKETTKLLP